MVFPVGILVMSGVIRQAEFVAFLKVGPPEVFPGIVWVFGLMQSVGADVALGLPPPAYNVLFEAQVYVVKIASTHTMQNRKYTYVRLRVLRSHGSKAMNTPLCQLAVAVFNGCH